jgi:hypothetical protein
MLTHRLGIRMIRCESGIDEHDEFVKSFPLTLEKE